MTLEGLARKRWAPLAFALALGLALTLVIMASDALHPMAAHAMTYSQARHVSTTHCKALIRKEAKREHLHKADVDALLWIAKRESGYHCCEITGSCVGVFQLMQTRAQRAKWHWYDPTPNTRRAIKYMKSRYGSIQGALRWWRKHHWY